MHGDSDACATWATHARRRHFLVRERNVTLNWPQLSVLGNQVELLRLQGLSGTGRASAPSLGTDDNMENGTW